jgi:arginine utilization protein RocB
MQMNGERIKEITLELVKIKSVVGTESENLVAEKIHSLLASLPYFKENKDNLFYVQNEGDPLKRKSLMAVLSLGDSNKAAALIGHIDTVGTSDFGHLEPLATEPELLTEALKKESVSQAVGNDLLSGNYLFGRGALDMKCGVATLIHLIEVILENPESFNGTLVFAFVSDEEGNSKGMLSCVPHFVRLKKELGIDYMAGIDTDYTSVRTAGDKQRYLYAGTVGKLLPAFYITGKETHVGDPFGGLDSNELSARLLENINLNMELADSFLGETTVPPISLRQKDLKTEYSVQTNHKTELYFNFSTHKSTPDKVLEKLKRTALKSFNEVIEKLDHEYKVYCNYMSLPYSPLPWKAKVLTYEELFDEVSRKVEGLQSKLDIYTEELMKSGKLDEREISFQLTDHLFNLWGEKEPSIILYFAPPYYAHMAMEGKDEKETRLLEALESLTEKGTKHPIVLRKFYPYISDLSYFSVPAKESIEALKRNMPGFGFSYKLPLDDIAELNLPVTNIGPYGFDAHKYTERLEESYSFHKAPDLLLKTVLRLLES